MTERVVNLNGTRIPHGGVFRCCLATVGDEYTTDDIPGPVAIGATSTCPHCGETFTLVDREPNPLWLPDSLEGKDE